VAAQHTSSPPNLSQSVWGGGICIARSQWRPTPLRLPVARRLLLELLLPRVGDVGVLVEIALSLQHLLPLLVGVILLRTRFATDSHCSTR
jgi:hypothetical protein